jgi:phosphoribosylanthranilate isomerase
MLQTKVILSRVTNLSDARYASGMGVDYIGFSINPANTQYVTVEQAKTIGDWLSGVSIIGDVGDSLTTDMADYSTSYIQTSNASIINELDEPILALDVNDSSINEVIDLLATYSSEVSFFVLNVENGRLSTLQPQLFELCSKYPVYISTEFDNQKLAYLLGNIKPTGIVLYGSTEEKPGFSSYDGIADILEQLEEE